MCTIYRTRKLLRLVSSSVVTKKWRPKVLNSISVLIYREEEESDSDEEMELHPLLTASLRTPITSKKKDIPPLDPPPLPPGWTAVNPGKPASIVKLL